MSIFTGIKHNTRMSNYFPPEITCPYCGEKIVPDVAQTINSVPPRLVFLFLCCGNFYYLSRSERNSWLHEDNDTLKLRKPLRLKSFSNIINGISPRFEKIYNEAVKAHRDNLLEICGGGYRKALEFLVYDYAIKKNPESETAIKKMGELSNVISTYLDGTFLKLTVCAASWLGNESLHYVQKYEDLGIDDLVLYIDDVVQAIELTERLEEKRKLMPKMEEKVLKLAKKQKD